MYSDDITLRSVIIAGLTTKGSELTAEEVDNNFVYLWQDLKAKLTAGAANLPSYNPVRTYTLGEVVGYDDLPWLYVNAVDDAGVTPGSDEDYWLSIDVEKLAHAQNTDQYLDRYGANEVSAAELRAFVDAGSTAANIYTTNGTLTSNRTVDLDSQTLTFIDGQVIIGDPIGTDALLEVYNTAGGRAIAAVTHGSAAITGVDELGVGVRGATLDAQGVYGYASGVGEAFFGESVAGTAGVLRGGLYVETYGFGGSIDASAIVESQSTTKGSLMTPRMTTAQRNAIVSPATGLEVYDITTGEFVRWNGSFWGISTQDIPIFHAGGWTPTGGQSVAFGSVPVVPINAVVRGNPYAKVLRGNRVIRGCDLTSWASGVAGSGEAWSLYIRMNGTTDYLVATVSSTSAIRNFNNQALNIPYVDGDNFRMILVNPLTWSTVPTAVVSWGNLKIS